MPEASEGWGMEAIIDITWYPTSDFDTGLNVKVLFIPFRISQVGSVGELS